MYMLLLSLLFCSTSYRTFPLELSACSSVFDLFVLGQIGLHLQLSDDQLSAARSKLVTGRLKTCYFPKG